MKLAIGLIGVHLWAIAFFAYELWSGNLSGWYNFMGCCILALNGAGIGLNVATISNITGW